MKAKIILFLLACVGQYAQAQVNEYELQSKYFEGSCLKSTNTIQKNKIEYLYSWLIKIVLPSLLIQYKLKL